ncbi:membrane-bound alkaline phosphatase-like [Teleopsis dalmanni]|uniref:membrane-bound alkaline phosphatase-like n=1 Tax=Teleopsis dalmanni TaxID=139649 RepID=UPI0018CD7426|nr:membrane-bound alkaline phosphatase-like [Teleopsis dalmanni]
MGFQLFKLLAFLVLLCAAFAGYVNIADVDVDFHPVERLVRGKLQMARGDMALNKYTPEEDKDPNFWINIAQNEMAERLKAPNLNKAKNIIMFLGDGMSLTTVTAARILKGQRKGNTGEEDILSFEKFPHAGLSRTYCTNAQVPDSACTATAYLCGVKTNIVNIGVSANVDHNNCEASMDPLNHVSSIADWAQAAGKSTGFVTTTTLTHASPAGSYAHVANRFWECDTDIRTKAPDVDVTRCMDIAHQLVTQSPGKNFQVVMGGGMGKFLPNTLQDLHGKMGERQDGKNLLSTWQAMNAKGAIVSNRDQLLNIDVSAVDKVMGIFESGVMKFHSEADPVKQPTLAEMTEVALKLLSKNENGYFVFIEGGLIDYGNHFNKPGISLDETLEFEKAIQLARDMTNPDDTLIVVTADHGHPLSISGYPGRGNPILGLNEYDEDANGVRYSTLNYAIGTNQYLDEAGNRIDLTGRFGPSDFIFPSYIKSSIGNHAGDDVGVWASGPYSHLFTGTMQQNTIPHQMAYSACIGNGPTMCDESNENSLENSIDNGEK